MNRRHWIITTAIVLAGLIGFQVGNQEAERLLPLSVERPLIGIANRGAMASGAHGAGGRAAEALVQGVRESGGGAVVSPPIGADGPGEGAAGGVGVEGLDEGGGIVAEGCDGVVQFTGRVEVSEPDEVGDFSGDSFEIEGEVGAKFDLFAGLNANIALFNARKRNVAYSEDVGGVSTVKAAGLVRSRGVEVDIAGSLTNDLDLIASYAYTDALVLDDPTYAGKRLPNVARHTGSLFLAYDVGEVGPNGNTLRIGGGVRAVRVSQLAERRHQTHGGRGRTGGAAVDVAVVFVQHLEHHQWRAFTCTAQ